MENGGGGGGEAAEDSLVVLRVKSALQLVDAGVELRSWVMVL